MGRIESRLRRLERHAGLGDSSAARGCSPSALLVQHLLKTLQIHKWGGTVYSATDSEIDIFGALVARGELSEEAGVYTFPSGASVAFTDAAADGSQRVEFSGRVEAEDLPEGLRRYVERMDPARQPEREQFLRERFGASDEEEHWGA